MGTLHFLLKRIENMNRSAAILHPGRSRLDTPEALDQRNNIAPFQPAAAKMAALRNQSSAPSCGTTRI